MTVSIDDNKTAIDLWQIIAHYGYAHQKEKAIEELNELAQALARDLQGIGSRENIAEEMADVHIMLGQLQLIYGNRDAVGLELAVDQLAAEVPDDVPHRLRLAVEQSHLHA